MPLHVHQRNIRAELAGNVVQLEVQEGHQIDGLDVVAPFTATLTLLHDRTGKIVDAALLKIGLVLVLHLNNDVLTCLGLTIDVVYQRAVAVVYTYLLLVKEFHIYSMHRSSLSSPLRNAISTGFENSCPKMRLKPTSVNGLMNFPIFSQFFLSPLQRYE